MNSVVIVTRCYHSHNVSIGLLLPSGSLCHPPRLWAFDNFLLELHNSSYHTQPHYMAAGVGGGRRKQHRVSRAKQLLCMYLTFAVSRPVARFLRRDAIQQVDGPNEAEGASLFVGGRGGGIWLSETAFRAFWRRHDKKTGSQKRNVDISQNVWTLKLIFFFFGKETTLCMFKKKNENGNGAIKKKKIERKL